MITHPIATIINFCSNEKRFLSRVIEEALSFSRQVIVVVCDHLFDGTLEDRSLLESIYASFPSCLFVEYPYVPSKVSKKILDEATPAHFWHNVSRLAGVHFLQKDVEWVLFLDADEIPEGKKVKSWLDQGDYRDFSALRLLNYWYFRSEENQALTFEDTPLFVQKSNLTKKMLLHRDERNGIYEMIQGKKERRVAGLDSLPMIHHFSWVRTQEEMLKKVRAWGHKEDRDWESLVHQEFKAPFQGEDFVHHYAYKKVEPLFHLSFEDPLKFFPKGAKQVKTIGEQDLFSFIGQRNFWRFFKF